MTKVVLGNVGLARSKTMSNPSSRIQTHRALFNADVIGMVLQCFYGCSDDTPTLLAAIRVHSSWTAPAARWLWRDISELVWLLKIVLPLKHGHKGWEPAGDFMFSAPGERIRFYARHIHTIGYHDWRYRAKTDFSYPFKSFISRQAFQHIVAAASNHGPLFSSLRALCWISYQSHHNEQLHFLASAAISPNLDNLFLQTSCLNPLPPWLSNLPIKTFEFSVSDRFNFEPGALSGAGESGGLARIIEGYVATRPRLTRLSIGGGDIKRYYAGRLERDVGHKAFVRRPLGVDYFQVTLWTGLNTFDRSIVPLLRCGDLVEFHFSGGFSRSLTEQDLQVMVSAWPSLTTLALHDGGWSRVSSSLGACRPIVSLSLIPAIGRSWPGLLYLSLTPRVDTPSPQDLLHCTFPLLRELDFGSSYIPKWQIPETAGVLAQICPTGVKIFATGWCDKRWDRVAMQMKEIGARRPQARVN